MRFIVTISMFCLGASLAAQSTVGQVWDLQSCIAVAIRNSLDVQQSELTVAQNELNLRQSKLNRLPDLRAQSSLSFQSGRNVDPFTNTYVQSTITNNSAQASSNLVLFAGGQYTNNIKFNRYAWLASEADLINVEQTISLNVANLFLQVAQARELLKSYQENLSNTNAQLEKAQKQFDAGVINEGTVLSLKAQMANDEANIVNAKNQERTALTSLKLLLRIPFEQPFEIELPSPGMLQPATYPDSLGTVFDSALVRRPDVKAAELRLLAYQYRRRATLGTLLPTLSSSFNLSTVYSSSAKQINGVSYGGWYTIGRVQSTNEIVEAPSVSYNRQVIDYSTQMKNNLGNSFGFFLSIPVFNRFQNTTNVRLADLDIIRYRIAYERSKQSLYNEVVTAYSAFESAMNRFKAAKLSYDAQDKNLEFVDKRFEAGQTGTLDLQMAKATAAAARVNLVSVQYEYIFRRMVLDFYMGQKLELK